MSLLCPGQVRLMVVDFYEPSFSFRNKGVPRKFCPEIGGICDLFFQFNILLTPFLRRDGISARHFLKFQDEITWTDPVYSSF